ncbi:hypothetical protein Tco_0757164, partial [Tanacetum coccineum]
FYTSAGNPVKEILLKLNLPDHRSILTDSKEYIKMDMEVNKAGTKLSKLVVPLFQTDVTIRLQMFGLMLSIGYGSDPNPNPSSIDKNDFGPTVQNCITSWLMRDGFDNSLREWEFEIGSRTLFDPRRPYLQFYKAIQSSKIPQVMYLLAFLILNSINCMGIEKLLKDRQGDPLSPSFSSWLWKTSYNAFEEAVEMVLLLVLILRNSTINVSHLLLMHDDVIITTD